MKYKARVNRDIAENGELVTIKVASQVYARVFEDPDAYEKSMVWIEEVVESHNIPLK